MRERKRPDAKRLLDEEEQENVVSSIAQAINANRRSWKIMICGLGFILSGIHLTFILFRRRVYYISTFSVGFSYFLSAVFAYTRLGDTSKNKNRLRSFTASVLVLAFSFLPILLCIVESKFMLVSLTPENNGFVFDILESNLHLLGPILFYLLSYYAEYTCGESENELSRLRNLQYGLKGA
uniref:Uncharacterized protein n=1 Tax=Aplanochytrium stocchinoi TaxID=215587 RepID=A0A7S3PLT4_9STRA|mmetsp:Transcript_22797/g.29091  ORF Transcript_22797/g.29091 Transcript_22797/m.29091 type:complete len:181 (-) Transcript_22797:326-868(-)